MPATAWVGAGRSQEFRFQSRSPTSVTKVQPSNPSFVASHDIHSQEAGIRRAGIAEKLVRWIRVRVLVSMRQESRKSEKKKLQAVWSEWLVERDQAAEVCQCRDACAFSMIPPRNRENYYQLLWRQRSPVWFVFSKTLLLSPLKVCVTRGFHPIYMLQGAAEWNQSALLLI